METEIDVVTVGLIFTDKQLAKSFYKYIKPFIEASPHHGSGKLIFEEVMMDREYFDSLTA